MTESTAIARSTGLPDEQDDPPNQVTALSDCQTLLPRPLASIVSFATATTSLGLRVGGFIGNAAISGARIGTLTSFELGRVVLEGILSRAGSDVAGSSWGERGRAEAENLLTRALSALHYSITSTSFLISAGFQIGSSSLSSGLAISQFFLSGLDAILGDTETSKAVATIVVLVQREFENPETGISGEKVGLGDLIVGATAFALLQRWGRRKTDQELEQINATETVWDIVTLNDAQGQDNPIQAIDNASITSVREESNGQTRPRSMSFVSATGEKDVFEGIGDGASFISTTSSRAFSNAAGHLPHPAEEAFRRQLADHLKPGSSVRLVAESITHECITVEVRGELDTHIDPPPGFYLTAVERHKHREATSTFVFQRKSRKRRHGSFDVGDLSVSNDASRTSAWGDGMSGDPVETDSHTFRSITDPTVLEESVHERHQLKGDYSAETDDQSEEAAEIDTGSSHEGAAIPVIANQKLPRSPLVTRSGQNPTSMSVPEYSTPKHILKGTKTEDPFIKNTLDQSPLRKALNKGKSVRNLVEFWSRERQRHPLSDDSFPRVADPRETPTSHGSLHPFTNTIRSQPLPYAHPPSGELPSIASAGIDNESSSFLREPRPTSSMSHRGHRSSANSITTLASENSLVLRPCASIQDTGDTAASLHRYGTLAGQFPRNTFVANAARFARFALASYGSNFLRLTGSFSGEHLTSIDDRYLPEHLSFSVYTNLPTSTVLLSSYVDHQSGLNDGNVESGMPLVYYVSLDHASKAVVLTCRGTLGFEDILTDMTCDYTNITWQSKTYQVHKGMFSSAKRLFTLNSGRVLATISAALEEFDDYGLVLCGHSMGGAVASVLAIMLAERNTTSAGGTSRFVTAMNSATGAKHNLPPNRPLHVYAYGPAACVSPELQYATRGLVTSVVHGNDIVPYLSLGTLRDFQAVALAFKIDSHVAKAEVRRRVWEGLVSAFRHKSGLEPSDFSFSPDWLEPAPVDQEDHWAWSALKSLRASLLTDKLVPPGEVYMVESASVLQRHAFVSSPTEDPASHDRHRESRTKSRTVKVREDEGEAGRRSYKPATRVTLKYVRDVERIFGEIKFGAGMFADHFPARYLRVLENLEKAIGG